MSNTAITPYLGGGVGISRNKMGDNYELMGFLEALLDGNTISSVCL